VADQRKISILNEKIISNSIYVINLGKLTFVEAFWYDFGA
jgi:hypothetical protein